MYEDNFMGNKNNGKKIILDESYNYLQKSYNNMKNKQSSSEKAPILFPKKNVDSKKTYQNDN